MSEGTEKTHFSADEVILYDADGHPLTPMHDVANLLTGIEAALERAHLVYEKTCQLKERINALIGKPPTQKELPAGKAKSKKE